MKIIVCASSEFAIATLSSLLRSQHEIVALVTKPDKISGRGYRLKPTPAKAFASKEGIFPIYDYRDPGSIDQVIDLCQADILVSVGFGGKIPPRALERLPNRGFNLHPSLLPYYRGAAPVQWALINGERQSGVTAHLLTARIDAGDILHQEIVGIEESDDYGSLSKRLSEVGAEVVLRVISALERGDYNPIPQDEDAATYAPPISKSLCKLNWENRSFDLFNRIRAFSPTPGAYTYIDKKLLKIFRAEITDCTLLASPGEVVKVGEDCFWVKTGDGALKIYEVQLEGRKRLPCHDFLNGYHLRKGVIFS